MKSILVYCGANTGNKAIYRETAENLGKIMAERNIQLIFGAGSVGLMGVVADSILAHGGKAIGIIPRFLDEMEVGHKNLTETYVVDTMHQRKAMMEQMTDAVITLPGGYGSMDELFEMLTWSQLGLHAKPIGILNVNRFYDHLLKQLDVMVEEGFLKAENRELVLVAETIDELMEKLQNFNPQYHHKWLDRKGI